MWLTALVLVFLELRHAASRGEWELIAGKALQFLTNQCALVVPTHERMSVEILMDAAKTAMSSVGIV